MTKFCCDAMKDKATVKCAEHVSAFDCPDTVIHQKHDGGFGIVIHDGGSSYFPIKFCPWCGANVDAGTKNEKLSPSVRLKGDQIVLKLGSATTVLEVNGLGSPRGDDVIALVNLLDSRRNEVMAKRDRELLAQFGAKS